MTHRELTALVANWGGAGEEVAETLPSSSLRRLLRGERFVPEVNAELPEVSTPYTLLADGSGAFPVSLPWLEYAFNQLSHAGVSAVTMTMPEVESYGDLVASAVIVRTPWLQNSGLHKELMSFGWERLLTLRCSVVVTSPFVLRRILNAERQAALGAAYYDQIRDNDVVERMCEL